MPDLLAVKATDVAFAVVFVWLVREIVRRRSESKSGAKTTNLVGPPPPSYIWGWSRKIIESRDAAPMYEEWTKEYGSAYQTPMFLMKQRITLFDPLAIAHYYAREETIYVRPAGARKFIGRILGKGVIWAEGDDHRRQRKTLSPGFSPQAVRDVTDVFFDSAHKAKAAWEHLLAASPDPDLIIDVQKWMNDISLDTIGIAGFGHDFQSLDGINSAVKIAFEALNASGGGIGFFQAVLFLLSGLFPILTKIPTKRRALLNNMSNTLGTISEGLFERSKMVVSETSKSSDRSLLSILLRAEAAEASGSALTTEEINAQMKTLLFAGYETSSITMSWILLELAKYPEKQERLRKELSQFGSDLTYNQLWSTTTAPYLDAVVKETLRLHPPVTESTREASTADVIPLSTPATTKNGEKVSSITVAEGCVINVPISAINRSEVFWGPDAQEWKPERWLEDESGLPPSAKELPGYHHVLSFAEGPRMCLGKGFAVTEIKSVMSVLVRNFHFAPRDGPDTEYDIQRSLLPRPKMKGEQGGSLPLRVRAIDH